MWTEHRNPEGRTYWFNTSTRESVWEKPDELKTPFERALGQTKWKEYFSNGRKYYYNTETKESKWDMPDELLLVLEKVEKETKPTAITNLIAAHGFTPVGSAQGAIVPSGGPDSSSSNSASQPNGQNGAEIPGASQTGALPFTPTSILPARPNLPDDPVIPHNGFATFEEGEKAFMHLLRKAGVDASWTWDQTMRAIITDPLYKALNSLAEKKTTWEKYIANLKAKEQEERENRLTKLRPAIRNMLKGNPNVFHYTTFPTADRLFSQHPIWQQAKIETERRFIFEEYVAELKQRDVQETRAARARSMSKLMGLFKKLDVDVVTRWRTAHDLVLESSEYKDDLELQKLPNLDILLAFEDYSRVREREYEDQMRKAQVDKTRRERKAREAFKELLQSLIDAGKIKARTKWKEIYVGFRDDERYLCMLGNPGSNPLELFWDAVDALDQVLDQKIAVVEGAVGHKEGIPTHSVVDEPDEAVKGEKEGIVIVTAETTEEDFFKIAKATEDDAVKRMSREDLHDVYVALHSVAVKKQADEKRRAERKQRHLQDDLRYALKRLSEPLDISMPYEEVVPLIEHLPEFKAVEDEEGRRAAFAKFIKRQKERMREVASEDGGSTTSRKRKEPTRDHRDGERDREKEKEKDRGDRDRDREHYRERDRERDRDKKEHDRERERDRSSRHHRYDDYDDHRRSGKEHGREKEKDYEKEKERDGYRSSRHGHYRDERDERRKDRDERKHGTRDWDERRDEKREKSEKRDVYDDRVHDERSEKRARYDRDEDHSMEIARAESPEEGEI